MLRPVTGHKPCTLLTPGLRQLARRNHVVEGRSRWTIVPAQGQWDHLRIDRTQCWTQTARHQSRLGHQAAANRRMRPCTRRWCRRRVRLGKTCRTLPRSPRAIRRPPTRRQQPGQRPHRPLRIDKRTCWKQCCPVTHRHCRDATQGRYGSRVPNNRRLCRLRRPSTAKQRRATVRRS